MLTDFVLPHGRKKEKSERYRYSNPFEIKTSQHPALSNLRRNNE